MRSNRVLAVFVGMAGLLSCAGSGLNAAEPALEKGFASPPDSARPWVYWFWLNSNITREGITADLEAMRRVGIGGVLIMEVDQGAPVGPVAFMSSAWRDLFKHVVAEAQRLGLEVNMNNDAGWNGSGGPWIKPEQSMQKVVWSETQLAGPRRFEEKLPQPQANAGFYRDITVLAFPATGDFRIADIQGKALFERRGVAAAAGAGAKLPQAMVIDRARVIDLGARMDGDGRLAWDVPAGNWTVLRLGHTTTGAVCGPSPESGRGLECDKLAKEGIDAHFGGMMGPLIGDVGGAAGKTLVATHIDSWEIGAQNWTGRMRDEFQRLRGYDPLLFLPVMTGRVVDSLEVSERFLWDLRQTVSDLLVDNYAGHLRELARRHGLKLSIEAYDGPCDDLTYAGRADEPMCEFWIGGGAFHTVKAMASAAHTYGRPILGAEAFTAGDGERWLEHPATIKALGDKAFCEGVNRFVFHRYAMQPWLGHRPGMTMGPWGLHYERTETWWEYSAPWHEYLSRCQFLLRQGLFVADVCYLQPEAAPQGAQGHRRSGYDYDHCTPEVVLTRMSVKDGRLVLKDGMSYRVLVLPEVNTMTPPLLRRLKDLVAAGATVIGPRPVKSPSLTDYPRCDQEIARLAAELWGDPSAGTSAGPASGVSRRAFGQGSVWETKVRDAESLSDARWIWFNEGSPAQSAPVGKRYFRRVLTVDDVKGLQTARILMTADNAFELRVNGVRAGSGNDFRHTYDIDVTSLLKPGANILAVAAENAADAPNPAGWIGSLSMCWRDGRTTRMTTDRGWESARDVHDGWTSNAAASPDWSPALELGPVAMAPWGPPSAPAPPDLPVVGEVLEKIGVPPDFSADRSLSWIHRRLDDADIYFVANGENAAVESQGTFRVSGRAAELWYPETGRREGAANAPTGDGRTTVPFSLDPSGSVFVVFRKEAEPAQQAAAGATRGIGRGALQGEVPVEVTGPWSVSFDPKWGGPASAEFPELMSWSRRPEEGIKHYSGAATYSRTIDVPPGLIAKHRPLYLDLGKVQVMAGVKLNGQDLGILWKPPFRADITGAVKAGENALEVKVVNLWVNRMIGDEHLPEDSLRHPNGTLREWPRWALEGKPSPTGRFTFTSWRLWKKDDPLQESGLLGPVRIVTGAAAGVK